MREIEITQALILDEHQSRLLDGHSLVNALSVVFYQIERVGALLDDPDLMVPLMEWMVAEVSELRDRLGNSTSDPADLRYLTTIGERLHEGLLALRPRVRREESEIFEHHLDNLESVFAVVNMRVAELVERAGDLHYYRTFTLAHVRGNLHTSFNAVAKNSFGRYRIAFSPETRTPGSFLMEFNLRSLDGHSILMPAVMEDVMRDLASNARKYTDPGGWVRVTLVEATDSLFVEVEDNGHGIPEDEIEKVIAFGCRGSNFDGRAQHGGGYGLTKAYNAVRTLGGRMWIRSGAEEGTRVRIELPSARRESHSPQQPSSLGTAVRAE